MPLRTSLFLLLFAVSFPSPAQVRVNQRSFRADAGGLPAGWRVWAPRDEIAPRAFVDAAHSRGSGGSLALSGNSNAAVYGALEHTVANIQPGRWYRLVAHYMVRGQTRNTSK